MDRLKQQLTNPMSIIAIFATLSEASAVVSLPFLDDDDREIYVWFLISFPFYLLFLFFATLNFNYRSLYAPSDFKSDEHFMKLTGDERPDPLPPNREPEIPEASCLAECFVRLSERIKDLYVVDMRTDNRKAEIRSRLKDIQQIQGKRAHLVVCITSTASQALLSKCLIMKPTKKYGGSMSCISFNSSSKELRVIAQPAPSTEVGSSAAEFSGK
ncbi:hypothetical protein [Pseudomonas violetae]|uniref:Uncharacterized protein n=1 Tax=Pseudomonas violetae TaxID=2915813 RepID=A0ABT0F062_9PSED|nr:hypothetical protein [Pseudomonas violetae]MCK1791392.1 hypothetical protein [Pseudomonas violetae]